MSFLGYISNGLHNLCNAPFWLHLLAPLIMFVDARNFPLFIVVQFVFWVCIFTPYFVVKRKTANRDNNDEAQYFFVPLAIFVGLFYLFDIVYVNFATCSS